MVLAYLSKSGSKLFSRHLRKTDSVLLDVLRDCTKICDRDFLSPDTNKNENDAVISYHLSPLLALLQGIESRYKTENYYGVRALSLPLIRSIHDVLQVACLASAYANIQGKSDEFWTNVKSLCYEAMKSSALFSIISDSAWYLLDDKTQDMRNVLFGLDQKEVETNKNPFYTALVSAFGEIIYESVITRMARKNGNDECLAISQTLQICINSSLNTDLMFLITQPSIKSNRLYLSDCSISYIAATLDSVLEFIRNNLFVLPPSLVNLIPVLNQFVEQKAGLEIVCADQFYITLSEYKEKFFSAMSKGKNNYLINIKIYRPLFIVIMFIKYDFIFILIRIAFVILFLHFFPSYTFIIIVVTDISSKKISKVDIEKLLESPRIIETYTTVAKSWNLVISEDEKVCILKHLKNAKICMTSLLQPLVLLALLFCFLRQFIPYHILSL